MNNTSQRKFYLSDDADLKICKIYLANRMMHSRKTRSEIIDDAVYLLYAAYALLPKDILDTAISELKKNDSCIDLNVLEESLKCLINTSKNSHF